MEKRKGDTFPPCLTPSLQSKNSEQTFKVEIVELMSLYKFKIKVKHLHFTPRFISLFHNPTLQTLLKACLESTK